MTNLNLDVLSAASASKKTNTAQKTVKNPVSDSVFKQYNNWMTKHTILMDKVIEGEISPKDYEPLKKRLGTTFDFMQGKDVNDEKEYNKQISKLSLGDFTVKDLNNDNKVEFSEYFTQEVYPEISEIKGDSFTQSYKKGDKEAQEIVSALEDAYVEAYKLFNIIDTQMGNGDLSLQADELQEYYTHLDEFTASKDHSTKRDGKIDIDFVSDYPSYLTNQLQLNKETELKLEEVAKQDIKEILDLE